jgi:hypothetical protein
MTSWLLWLKIHAWIGRLVMEWHMLIITQKPHIPLQRDAMPASRVHAPELARYIFIGGESD